MNFICHSFWNKLGKFLLVCPIKITLSQVVWIESLTNPTLKVVDIQAIADIAHNKVYVQRICVLMHGQYFRKEGNITVDAHCALFTATRRLICINVLVAFQSRRIYICMKAVNIIISLCPFIRLIWTSSVTFLQGCLLIVDNTFLSPYFLVRIHFISKDRHFVYVFLMCVRTTILVIHQML